MKTAKVYMNGRCQLVRLPKEFRLASGEVQIRREGDALVLSPPPLDWVGFLASGLAVSDGFGMGFGDEGEWR